MGCDFTGLVKAKKEDLESAIKNWNAAYREAEIKCDELLERSKGEYLDFKFLWFFPYKENTYEHIKSQVGWEGKYWTATAAIKDLYPEDFTQEDSNRLHNEGYFDDIEAMYNTNPDEVYLSPEQAAKVMRWK